MQDGSTIGDFLRDWETHRAESDRWEAVLEYLDDVPVQVRRREQRAFIAACQEVGLPPEEVSNNFIERYAEQAVGGCEMVAAHIPDGARRILEIAAAVDELLDGLRGIRPLRSRGRASVLDRCAITLGLQATSPDQTMKIASRALCKLNAARAVDRTVSAEPAADL